MANTSFHSGQGSDKLRLMDRKEKVSQAGCEGGGRVHPEQALLLQWDEAHGFLPTGSPCDRAGTVKRAASNAAPLPLPPPTSSHLSPVPAHGPARFPLCSAKKSREQGYNFTASFRMPNTWCFFALELKLNTAIVFHDMEQG